MLYYTSMRLTGPAGCGGASHAEREMRGASRVVRASDIGVDGRDVVDAATTRKSAAVTAAARGAKRLRGASAGAGASLARSIAP